MQISSLPYPRMLTALTGLPPPMATTRTGIQMANKPRRSAHDLFDRLAALEKKLAEVTTAQGPALPKLLTVQELADLLRTTPKAVRLMRDKGQLPEPLDIGSKRLLWREAVVIAWLGHTELRAGK